MSSHCCKCGFDHILEDTLHPGGLKFTERLAEVAVLKPGCRVLEIGCGKGVTTLFLARHYGCSIIGVDMSPIQIASARDRTKNEGLALEIGFITADAKELPLPSNRFDVVFSECSISLVSDKKRAVDEAWRVLKPGGRLAMTDLIRQDGAINNECGGAAHLCPGSFASLPCIDNAESVEVYMRLLKEVGFQSLYTEDCTLALKEALFRMRLRFGQTDAMLKEIGCACNEYKDIIPEKQRIRTKIGYALISATKGVG